MHSEEKTGGLTGNKDVNAQSLSYGSAADLWDDLEQAAELPLFPDHLTRKMQIL